MLTLAIDSSAGACGCALLNEDKLLAESFIDVGLTHSRTLLPMVEATLQNAGITLPEVDRLAVALGPGSFTGVRIGVSTIKGLAFGLERPCVGVSTLLAMAHGFAGLWEGPVCAVMDARVGQVYAGLFELAAGGVTRLTADAALPADQLQAQLPPGTLLVGDGAHLLYREDGPFKLAPGHLRIQRAVGVGLAARGLPPVPADQLQPVYLRRPQAEREYLARQQTETSL